MTFYGRKDLAVLGFVAGLFTGLILGFSACTPDPDEAGTHITTGGIQ